MMMFFINALVQIKLLNLWLQGEVLTPETSKATGVAGRPKALPY